MNPQRATNEVDAFEAGLPKAERTYAPESTPGVIIDPRPNGDGGNLLINAYDAQVNPFARWANEGLLRYVDHQKATPVIGSFLSQLTGLSKERGRATILKEKNLAGCGNLLKHDATTQNIRERHGRRLGRGCQRHDHCRSGPDRHHHAGQQHLHGHRGGGCFRAAQHLDDQCQQH